ncbi:MAG: hypothetical protein AB1420_18710 [Bacillota bacterium]
MPETPANHESDEHTAQKDYAVEDHYIDEGHFPEYQGMNVDIRGSTTLREISDKYNIPLERIYEVWSLPSNTNANTRIAELMQTAGIEMSEFKQWINSEITKRPKP